MSGLKMQGASYGELMDCLLKERPKFATDEEFKAFVVAEVRRLITDLRDFNVELTLRPSYAGALHLPSSATEKLAGN